jgi:hypothetical protein
VYPPHVRFGGPAQAGHRARSEKVPIQTSQELLKFSGSVEMTFKLSALIHQMGQEEVAN